MLIISAGMQKSGSAFIYNIINELEIISGNPDAREIKNRYFLKYIMQMRNNNIGSLLLPKLLYLYKISENEGDFAVKTHSGPGLFTSFLAGKGMIKIIYSYRDPRDCLLSAIDYGRRIIANGQKHTFAKMVDFDVAVTKVKKWIRIWKKYRDMDNVYMLRYEDMIENPLDSMENLEKYLGITINENTRQEILWKYSSDNPDLDRVSMHLNKVKCYRYRDEMNKNQKDKCIAAFGNDLVTMGYTLQ